MKIVNKHIVITGGASGIGLELVKQLYSQNALSVIARPSQHLDALRANYPDITIFEADLSDLDRVRLAADQLIKTEQSIDILINNAAVQYVPYFLDEDFRLETIKREVDINFTSVCMLIYLLLPALIKQDPSIILNVNSGLAIAPKASSAVYCATKGALNLFSQSLGYQLEATNVEVKQVFLPLVDTAMTKGRGSGKISPEEAAFEMINALSKSGGRIDIGKVKFLRLLQRLSPALASQLMKGA